MYFGVIQQRRKAWIDRQIKFKLSQKGSLVLMYNSKLGLPSSKLKLWSDGTYKIMEVLAEGTLQIVDI